MTRWLGLVLTLAVLAAAALTVRMALDPLQFPVAEVTVEGRFVHLTQADLERAVAGRARGGFFTVDLEAVRGAVAELPWVKAVRVRRVWPDAIHVEVQERAAAAALADGSLVDEDGESFRPEPQTIPAGLPVLDGPVGQEPRMLDHLRSVRETMGRAGVGVTALSVDPRGSWRLATAAGYVVVLGREPYGEGLERLVRVLESTDGLGQRPIEQVDLRYPNGFAVRWGGPSDASARGTDG